MTTMPLLSDLFDWNEDHDKLTLTHIEYSVDKMFLVVCYERVDYGDADDIKEYWHIDVINPVKHYFEPNINSSFDLKKEHPLLWEYNNEQVSLYFEGYCPDVSALHYGLYTIHQSITSGYTPFAVSLTPLIKRGNNFLYSSGLMARGPRNLLTLYADCMKAHGLGSSIIAGYIPREKPKSVLFFPGGYVVAEDFSFTLVNT